VRATVLSGTPRLRSPAVQSLWSDRDAAEFVERYSARHGEDLALRVYTSRLLGREPRLVLHGGGNTSVKTVRRDLRGEAIDVLCVKGSGSDLAVVEPRDLPALELAPLRALRDVARLSDGDMVRELRRRLLDPASPTPSVETLLHAHLPPRFVDHTHADAVLVLTNQPDGEALGREAFGPQVPVLPWIFPGFPLSRAVADAFDARPDCEGIVLRKHGIFTFGASARESYEAMIALVTRAEAFLARRAAGKVTMLVGGDALPAAAARARALEVLPVLRGALALPVATPHGQRWQRVVAEWRGDEDLRRFTSHAASARLLALGPLTPDHVLRTKGPYLALREDEARDPERCRAAVARYVADYRRYFAEHGAQAQPPLTMLAPTPNVAVVEGLGVFACGRDAKAARIAADIAQATLRGKALGEAIGRYEALSPGELFEMEYWSLEQAKLGKQAAPPLAGQVALLTGAGGAIGHGIANALLGAGAHVLVTDVDEARLAAVAAKLRAEQPGAPLAAARLDVTDPASVRAGFEACVLAFGGVDVVVPNAGIAYVAPIAELDAERWRRVFDVNCTGTMLVLREAARLFERQRTGGAVVVQASKNVFEPGASFAAYSASKAAQHQLGKVAALEFAPLGVRVNMVNADAVFGDDVPSGLWQEVGPDRMRARGLDEHGLREFYRERSLLKTEVLPAHVGAAVVFFASGVTPTTGATLPVDGGLPGAFPR
jgi:rhamnulose-1-phosphate aldolase/alcohol dehydrogenase